MRQLIETGDFHQRLKAANEFNSSMQKKSGAVMKVNTKKFEKSYDVKTRAEIKNLLATSFHPWVEYPIQNYSPTLQKNYEIFCGGWLHFWDKNISTEMKERQIYFEWGPNSVRIYISNESKRKGYRITLIVDGPGDPPVAPPPPPPGDA